MLLIRYLSLLFYTALVCGVKVIDRNWGKDGSYSQNGVLRSAGYPRQKPGVMESGNERRNTGQGERSRVLIIQQTNPLDPNSTKFSLTQIHMTK